MPRGHQETRARRPREPLAEHAEGIGQEVFEPVEHEQHRAACGERLGDSFAGRHAAGRRRTDRVGHRVAEPPHVARVCELDEADLAILLARKGERPRRLADPGGSHERHQPLALVERAPQLLEDVSRPEELGRGERGQHGLARGTLAGNRESGAALSPGSSDSRVRCLQSLTRSEVDRTWRRAPRSSRAKRRCSPTSPRDRRSRARARRDSRPRT